MSTPPRILAALVLAAAVPAALAGCGGKHATAPAAPQAGATPYASIFVERPAVKYRYTVKSEMYDPDDPTANASGNVVEERTAEVTCATRTRTDAGFQIAEITCEGADGSQVLADLATTFVAGPAGLWRLEAGETFDAGALAQRPVLLAAKPVPVEDKTADESEQFGTSHAVRGGDAAWCIEDASWGGDESGGSICIDRVRGVSSVTRYFAGGSTHDESLELVD